MAFEIVVDEPPGHLSAALRRDAGLVILNDCPPQLARRILTHGRRIMLLDRVVDAVKRLDPIREFLDVVRTRG